MTTLSESLSVGIIGLGYGRAHISAFQANGCRVTALGQRDERRPRRSRTAMVSPVVMAELASGAQATLMVSRVAHATNVQTLEAWGSGGALSYRLARDGARWFEGELRASRGNAGFQPVAPSRTPPSSAGEGDPTDVIGKALIAPLVERMLRAIRIGEPVSPSLVDGLRAQMVLDAVLASLTRRAWVDVGA